ncbi:hypothetical protein FACS1894196_4220 [Clostridia bacterium]|nr:hypothetical protein FACS1894196_4220 [Clostridia bacterium]
MTRRMYRALALGILLCLLAGAAVAETPPTVRSQVEIEGYPVPDVPERDAEEGYFAGAVLAGDSIAGGVLSSKTVPELDVIFQVGMSAHDAIGRRYFKAEKGDKLVSLRDALVARKPRIVYLWMGLNGVASSAPWQVLESYHLLLNQLIEALPDTLFYLIEVTPVRKSAQNTSALLTNKNVDKFNEGLRALALEHNVYLLPVNALLRNENDLLDGQYAGGGGYHLATEAYTVLADYFYTHTVPLD